MKQTQEFNTIVAVAVIKSFSIVFIEGVLELMDKCFGDICIYICINDVNIF